MRVDVAHVDDDPVMITVHLVVEGPAGRQTPSFHEKRKTPKQLLKISQNNSKNNSGKTLKKTIHFFCSPAKLQM